MRNRIAAALICLGLSLSVACVRVQSHQREMLAHPAMQAPVWTEESKSDQHVFEVREGSSGARKTVGGGCGCN